MLLLVKMNLHVCFVPFVSSHVWGHITRFLAAFSSTDGRIVQYCTTSSSTVCLTVVDRCHDLRRKLWFDWVELKKSLVRDACRTFSVEFQKISSNKINTDVSKYTFAPNRNCPLSKTKVGTSTRVGVLSAIPNGRKAVCKTVCLRRLCTNGYVVRGDDTR